jgi:hypothetical protein
MTRIGERRGRTDIHLLVSLAAPRDEKVFIICKYFKELDVTRTSFRYGGYEGEESDSICLTAVISVVNLASKEVPIVGQESSDASMRVYILDPADKHILDNFLATERQRRVGRARRPSRTEAAAVANSGASPQAHATCQSLLTVPDHDGGPARVVVTTRIGRAATRIAR